MTKESNAFSVEEWEAVIARIAEEEGFRASAYQDNKTDKNGKVISQQKSVGHGLSLNNSLVLKELTKLGYTKEGLESGEEQIKREDSYSVMGTVAKDSIRESQSLIKDFNNRPLNVKSSVVDLVYNMGGETVKDFDETIKLINKGDYHAASQELLDSKYARKDAPARAKRNSEIMKGESLSVTEVPTSTAVTQDPSGSPIRTPQEVTQATVVDDREVTPLDPRVEPLTQPESLTELPMEGMDLVVNELPVTEQSTASPTLFNESEKPATTMMEWGNEKLPVPPPKEQVSISLLQEGHKTDTAMLDAHKEVQKSINMGDESAVQKSSINTWKNKVDRRRQEMLSSKKLDLEKLHKDEVLLDGIWSPLEHKIAATEDTLTTKLINQTAEDNPEELERLKHLLASGDSEIRYRQAINNANRMLASMDEELGFGEAIVDVGISVFQPLAEAATFHNVITEVVPAANLSGVGIPSQDADDFVKYIVGLPKEEGVLAINDFIDAVYKRQNQLGVAENKLTNIWVAQVLMNYLQEDRSTEEGAGFLGMQNVTDFGLNVLAGLDFMNAAQLAEFGGMIIGKSLRKPKPYKDFVQPDKSIKISTFSSIILSHNILSDI